MGNHVCHFNTVGQLKCWGYNNNGQLGQGDTAGRGDGTNEMGPYLKYIQLGTGLVVDDVVMGDAHTCAHFTTNIIKCWGNNANGQLGLGDTDKRGDNPGEMGNALPSPNLGSNLTPTKVVCGRNHSCVLFSNKKVKCFGSNDVGQIGMVGITKNGTLASDMGDNLQIVPLGTNDEVESIHSGPSANHNCVILTTSQLMKCWGSNASGELGYGDTANRGYSVGTMGDNLLTVDLGDEDKVKAVTLGNQFTCALRVDDEMKCWGINGNGQLGLGSTTSPVKTMGASLVSTSYDSGKKIKLIAAGDAHLCVLFDDNATVKCVGNNGSGQLGQGDTSARGNSPTNKIPDILAINLGTNLPQISKLRTIKNSNCVIFVDNKIKCFGYGGYGELGSGSTANLGDAAVEMGDGLKFVDVFSTFAPTKAPTLVGATISPTKTPINAPTKAPTYSPTSKPTKNPVKNPSKSPTFNPTRKPTSSFFTSSLIIQAFDLYLLIDTTRAFNQNDFYCKQYKLMSGVSPSSCFDLMMDYAIEIVKSISVATNGYYSNDLSKGLRVQASLIQCVGSTKTPSSTTLFTLTGDSSIIMNGLNNVRTNIPLTETASCPLQGLYDVIQKIENEWSSVNSRPYKAIITLTDAQVNDASGSAGNALINSISAIRYRCTPSIVVVPFRMTDTSTQALNQQLSLKILSGNIDASVFEAKNAPWKVIPKIGEQITSLLKSSNARCPLSTSFSTTDKYWCGYNKPALCTSRTSCEFISGGTGCRKIATQSGCVFGDQTSCEAKKDCQWKSNACTRKPEEPDCNALVLQSSCNSKSSFCSWNGSGCVINTVG